MLPFSDDNMSLIQSPQANIEEVLLREEMFQHQRSRINWLTYGDKNSAFFHATVTQRRQRNQLIKLQTTNGEWLESDEAINGHLRDYFQTLYQALPNRDLSEALEVVHTTVNADMNRALTRSMTDDEIKAATFQLGA